MVEYLTERNVKRVSKLFEIIEVYLGDDFEIESCRGEALR